MKRQGVGHGPHPVDLRVGRRLSDRRKLLGLSEGDLAEALGLTVAEVRAHEFGLRPIAASRLQELARLLGVSVGFFFGNPSGMTGGGRTAEATPDLQAATRMPDRKGGTCPRPVAAEPPYDIGVSLDKGPKQIPSAEEVLRLVRQFSRVADPDLRAFAIDQMAVMAERCPAPLKKEGT